MKTIINSFRAVAKSLKKHEPQDPK